MTKPSNDDNFTTNELFASNSSIDLSFVPHIFFSFFLFFFTSCVDRCANSSTGERRGEREGGRDPCHERRGVVS